MTPAVKAGLVGTALLTAPAAGAERLDVASTFGTNNFLGQVALKLGENIETATAGEVTLKVHEPGDLVPAFEVFNAVSTGALPAGWDWIGYWSDTVPVTKFYGSLPFGPDPAVFSGWMWEGGGREILQGAYDPYNVKVLPCLMNAQETGGWFNKEITSVEDYKGLKMRISGLGAKVIEKLGASPQLIPGPEIYTALERGRIDATEFANPLVDQNMGFDEIAEYYYFPGWHQSASWMSLMVNMDVWNGLAPETQAQMELACRATLQWSMAVNTAEQMKALNALRDKGVDVRRLPEPVIAALKETWQEVREEEMAASPLFAEAYESLAAYQALVGEWDRLQAVPRDADSQD
jgi:TRAP-type mannitol/chloroaromatic compound transport system substrate-binding protein